MLHEIREAESGESEKSHARKATKKELEFVERYKKIVESRNN
jgi:hypothetical protein